MGSILRGMVGRYPNLKTIFYKDPTYFLETFPEYHYSLAAYLCIKVEYVPCDEAVRNKVQKLVEERPKLRQLHLAENIVEYLDSEQAVKILFTQLLQSCTESLEELDILYFYDFQTILKLPLSHTPFRNLTHFSLEMDDADEAELENLWYSLAAIDGEKMMPKLEQMTLRVSSAMPSGTV